MMPGNKKLLLIGAGGHCKSVIDTLVNLATYSCIGIIEKKEIYEQNIVNKNTFMGVPIVGTDANLQSLHSKGYTDAFITIGSVGDTTVRKAIYNNLKKFGFHIPNIIDVTSIVSSSVEFGEGIFIGKHVIVNANVKLGDCVILNTGSIIEHDCKIESFVHISPGSVLCGNVWVEQETHVGAGSVIKQGIHIGEQTMIGLGSVVIKSIGSHKTAYGNPCREV